MKKHIFRQDAKKAGTFLFMVVFILTIILPVIWLVLGSFKNQNELFTTPVTIFPAKLRWENYKIVFRTQPMMKYIWNSLLIAVMTTVIVVISASMASYSLSRVNIKGKRMILVGLLAVTLLPPATLLNPVYMLLSKLNLLNTHIGLALAVSAIEIPMAVWFLTGYFDALPSELEESALIDGTNIFQLFTKIILPLLAPGVFTISILVFINAWNNYLFAQVFNPLPKARTVTVALTLLRTDEYTIPWETMSAGSVIITFPLLIMVFVLQKRIISGLLDGGVKG